MAHAEYMNADSVIAAAVAASAKKMQSAPALVGAAFRGHVPVMAALLGDARVDPSHGNNAAVAAAVRGGHAPALACLLADARVTAARVHPGLMAAAAKLRHMEVAEVLDAAACGFPGLLRALLPGVAPLERWWTRSVCDNGHAGPPAQLSKLLSGRALDAHKMRHEAYVDSGAAWVVAEALRDTKPSRGQLPVLSALLHNAHLTGPQLRSRAILVLDDAISKGDRDMAALVMAHPRLDTRDAVAYVLHYGAERGVVAVLRELVTCPAHAALLCPRQVQEAVIEAASRNLGGVVQVLVGLPYVSVASVLRTACQWRRAHVVEALLADAELVRRAGDMGRALVAATRGGVDVLRMVLAAGQVTNADAGIALRAAMDFDDPGRMLALLAHAQFDFAAVSEELVAAAVALPETDKLAFLLGDRRFCPVGCRASSRDAASEAEHAHNAQPLLAAYSEALYTCAKAGRAEFVALLLEGVALAPAACDRALRAAMRRKAPQSVLWELLRDGRAHPGAVLLHARLWKNRTAAVSAMLPACVAQCRWWRRRSWLRATVCARA
jgi:hypothetical protein